MIFHVIDCYSIVDQSIDSRNSMESIASYGETHLYFFSVKGFDGAPLFWWHNLMSVMREDKTISPKLHRVENNVNLSSI